MQIGLPAFERPVGELWGSLVFAGEPGPLRASPTEPEAHSPLLERPLMNPNRFKNQARELRALADQLLPFIKDPKRAAVYELALHVVPLMPHIDTVDDLAKKALEIADAAVRQILKDP